MIGSKIYYFGGRDLDFDYMQSSKVYCRKPNTWSLIAPFGGSHIECCCVCIFYKPNIRFWGYI